MNLERQKKSMVVNGKGAKAAPKKKTSAKASPKKKKTAKKAAPAPEAPKRRRRAKRKKNPSVDVAGSFVAAAGGAIAAGLAGPATAGLAKFVQSDKARKVLGPIAAGVVPFGIGLGVQLVAPTLGKGICAGAGAEMTSRGLGMVGEKVEVLRKVGFLSSLPKEFSFQDGQLFREMPDGTKKVLFAATPKTIELEMADGTVQGAQLLGAENGHAVILDEMGNVRVLSGLELATPLNGIEMATPLGGIEMASQLDGEPTTHGYSA